MREMQRRKQALSREECIDILRSEPRGVLSVFGTEGYPYGMPLDHWYCESDGKLYFHSGLSGHRTDAIRANDRVSYCVLDGGRRAEDNWWLIFRSVIVFGRVEIVEDHEKALEICRALSRKYTRDEAYIDREIRSFGENVLVFSLDIEHISGKTVTER